LRCPAIIRIETPVVTVGTTALPPGAIPVGTGKACVEGYFLNLPVKGFPVITRIIVVSLIAAPNEFQFVHPLILAVKLTGSSDINEHYNVNKFWNFPGYMLFSFSYIHHIEKFAYVNSCRPGTNKGKRRQPARNTQPDFAF
jgi:hypothetical protein